MRVRGQQTVSGVGVPAIEMHGMSVGAGYLRLNCRGGAAGDVEAALVIDSHRGEKPENAANAELGEVSERFPGEVCRWSRGSRSAAARLGWPEAARVEAAHTVPDHVDWLVGKSLEDLLAQPSGTALDTGDRGYAGDEHAVARGGEGLGDRAEIGSERDRPQADPGEAEKAVRSTMGAVSRGILAGGDIEGAVSIRRLLHAGDGKRGDAARLDRETRLSFSAQTRDPDDILRARSP